MPGRARPSAEPGRGGGGKSVERAGKGAFGGEQGPQQWPGTPLGVQLAWWEDKCFPDVLVNQEHGNNLRDKGAQTPPAGSRPARPEPNPNVGALVAAAGASRALHRAPS